MSEREKPTFGDFTPKDIMEEAGDNIEVRRGDWRFDKPGVAQNFDTHVSRSVPFYNEVQQMVGSISDWFIDRGSKVYDVGCSTGTTINMLADKHDGKDVTWVGIDEVESMLVTARAKLSRIPNVHLIRDRIPTRETLIRDANFVTSLWAMQFCRKKDRADYVGQIYDGMVDGGALVLVEKILGSSPLTNGIFIELYHDHKEFTSGYTLSQVASKARSLRGVLVPDSALEHEHRLYDTGFRIVDRFFQYLNFAGWIAVK